MSDKRKKTLSIIIIACAVIIILEFLLMVGYRFITERNVNRINGLNDVIKIDDGYIGVGMSDFHNSHFINEEYYEYTNSTTKEKQNIIRTQARIAKYDENFKVQWENTIKAKYDSMFNSVLVDDDGYVAVGCYIESIEQIENNTRTAIIVKYDKTGKMMWKNTYKVLSDTRFFKVIKDNDSYVVVGTSIYENMEMGNHITGGGIIVRYSLTGEEQEHNNYGGNKSGSFNDIISVDDGYIVCGKDASNYGIVLKFAKNFGRDDSDTGLISNKIIWNKTFSNTDTAGFSSMIKLNDILYIAGAINVSNEKNEEGKTIFKYDAGIARYDVSGKYLGSTSINNDTHHRFNSIIGVDNTIYLSMLQDVDTYYDGGKERSVLFTYDIASDKFNQEKTFDGNNDFVINKLVRVNNNNLIVGTTNDKCTIRGCDYKPIIEYVK